MRPSHLLPAMLLAVAGLTPASAADLTRLDRSLKDEPKYNTRAPKYCLLVFGQDARTRVWLVHDGDVVHVLASPDCKAPAAWRHVKGNPVTFSLGDVWDEGGKTCYKNLRFYPGVRIPRLMVLVGKHQHAAGRDRRGTLQFAASAKEAPVVHFDGPLTLDLFRTQEALTSNADEDLTAVVGTPGVGPGTFAVLPCDAYPDKCWPTAVIEFPAKDKGKPIVAKVRLAED